MRVRPNFATMAQSELRAYILANRDDEEALHFYLDRLHAENSNPQRYSPKDDVSEAIENYLKNKSDTEI